MERAKLLKDAELQWLFQQCARRSFALTPRCAHAFYPTVEAYCRKHDAVHEAYTDHVRDVRRAPSFRLSLMTKQERCEGCSSGSQWNSFGMALFTVMAATWRLTSWSVSHARAHGGRAGRLAGVSGCVSVRMRVRAGVALRACVAACVGACVGERVRAWERVRVPVCVRGVRVGVRVGECACAWGWASMCACAWA